MKNSYDIDYFLHGFWKARESTYLHRKSIFCGETFWNYIQSFRLPHRNFKLKYRSCPGSKCLQIMQKSCHFSAFFNPVAKKWRNRSFQHLCILPLFTHVQKNWSYKKYMVTACWVVFEAKIHEKLLFLYASNYVWISFLTLFFCKTCLDIITSQLLCD